MTRRDLGPSSPGSSSLCSEALDHGGLQDAGALQGGRLLAPTLGYADYYRSVYPHDQEHRSFGGLKLFRAPRHPAGQYVEKANGLSFQLSRASRPGVSRMDLGAGRFTADLSAPNYVVAPPGHACTYDLTSDIDLLVIEFSSEAFSEYPWRRRDAGPLHHGARHDALLIQFAERIWKLSALGLSQLEAESLGMALATLLANQTQSSPITRQTKGGLTPRELKRVTEYMKKRLADDVSLAELAALVSRSPFHFARAFKISVGMPPHRYLMTLRVEYAKELLSAGTLTVSQVAYACGFASSQHFATVFRRMVGTTATQFRRERTT